MSKARLVLKDVMRHPVVRSIPVQWGEMDAFQHVNNTVYFKYFEGKASLFRSRVWVPLHDIT